ncbi:MobA/MobL family protein [Pacificimonas flava]|uniref:MobA/MobL family protein n=1 Tax=Pacificimonas flava TaxID=1234595 RepID=UPI00135F195A|nr:MobA/MobL family protein [Pacificimonas flava]MBB5281771.1 hypothetical protein [Pacificimonas flava]
MSGLGTRKPFVCRPVSIQWRGSPASLDSSKTALSAAAYIRRTRFELSGMDAIDFVKRRDDLLAVKPFLPSDEPEWTRSTYLRWKKADEVSEATANPEDIRAWHVVGDLPEGATPGEWLDGCSTLVQRCLPRNAVADLALHVPQGDTPPHMHLLVASRKADSFGYHAIDYDLHRQLDVELRIAWLEWCTVPLPLAS